MLSNGKNHVIPRAIFQLQQSNFMDELTAEETGMSDGVYATL